MFRSYTSSSPSFSWHKGHLLHSDLLCLSDVHHSRDKQSFGWKTWGRWGNVVDGIWRAPPGLAAPHCRASPNQPMAQDPSATSASPPTAISPCPSDTPAGLVSSSPQPCPDWPWALPSQTPSVGIVLAQPQPLPKALPSHVGLCLMLVPLTQLDLGVASNCALACLK